MIYVCEYDGSFDALTLQRISEQFPLTFPEGWQSGRKREKARQRILAWLLLAYGIEQAGADIRCQTRIFQSLQIKRDVHGKPFSVRHPELSFNLSHCDTACACIIGNNSVGVDVERKFPYKENLERSFCHPKEQAILETLNLAKREKQQQILWSLKESLVKLNGRGIGYGLKNIDLSEFLPIIDGKHQILIQMEPGQYTVCVQTDENYTLAACTASHMCITDMNVEKVTENELSMWIKKESIY